MLHEYVNHDSHPTRLVLVSIISTTLLIVSLSVNITTTNSSICTDIYLN